MSTPARSSRSARTGRECRCATISPMFGGRSIKLVELFGIRIGVDLSWFIVLFLIIWSLAIGYGEIYPGDETLSFGLATASALLFFTSVVLHELGHALIAIRNGIGIAGIDLFLFGGVAKMRRDTDSAGVEFRVAIAGPLVSLTIVVICAGVGVGLVGFDAFLAANPFAPQGAPAPVVAVLAYLASINALLLAFNLIPGYPLDGGRIVRAIAWKITGDRTRATRFAATIGRGFSYVLIAVGLYVAMVGDFFGGLWLGVIGLFLGQAARGSVLQTEIASQLDGLTVADVMDSQPVAVPLGLTLDRTLDEFFLRYREEWFPVVDEDGRPLGLITREAIEAIPEERHATATAAEVLARDELGGLQAPLDEPIEAFIDHHRDGLARLGAVLAVDAQGILRGIVTTDRLRRALRPAVR